MIAPEVDPEDLEEQADTAADFLEELMGHMGIDAVAEPNLHHDHMYVDIVGEDEDDMALLIGRHGQTLDAIQELTRMVVGQASGRAGPGDRRRRGLPQAPRGAVGREGARDGRTRSFERDRKRRSSR